MVVEHAAVNRGVVSSSLTGAAKKYPEFGRASDIFIPATADPRRCGFNRGKIQIGGHDQNLL